MHCINMINQLPMQKRLNICVFSFNFTNLWWGLLLLWFSMHFLLDETHFLIICAIIIVHTFRSHVFNTFIIHIYLEFFLLMSHKKKWTTMCKYTDLNNWNKILQMSILCATLSILCTIVFTLYCNIWIKQTNLLRLSW